MIQGSQSRAARLRRKVSVAWEERYCASTASVEESIHVVPLDDLKDHDHTGECWCNPEPEYDNPVMVYIHNSLDGRELEFH